MGRVTHLTMWIIKLVIGAGWLFDFMLRSDVREVSAHVLFRQACRPIFTYATYSLSLSGTASMAQLSAIFAPLAAAFRAPSSSRRGSSTSKRPRLNFIRWAARVAKKLQ